MAYYDGTKLLSLNDINGKKPEIYMCTTNRTGGKTTYFGRLLINRFLAKKECFMLLYRYNYELDNVADKFFTDLQKLFFSNYEMKSVRQARGIYHELYLNDEPCGYAVALNNADQIKRFSHLFTDTSSMLFDEFQSETNHYCPNEIGKFISIHTSVARGRGKQVRYVPVYMLSNAVSLINPYYTEMGISNRLTSSTKFLKGDGYVLEQGFVESASKAILESGFNRAFGNTQYVSYASQNVYLNDNSAFIDKLTGKNKYVCTLKYKGKCFGIREFPELGIMYCDESADSSYPVRFSITTDDHQVNYLMLRKNDFFLTNMRYIFEHGCFRFKNLLCKEAILTAISY